MEGKSPSLGRKQKDLENTIRVLKEQNRLFLNEKRVTILEWIGLICNLMEERSTGFLARNIHFREEIGDFLQEVTTFFLLEELSQNQKVKLSTLLEEFWEINKNMELREFDFQAQNVGPWMKMVDLLKKAKRIVVEDSLNWNHKEKLSACSEEICEMYKKMEVRNMDFCALNTVLWKKTVALLEEFLEIFPEKNGNQNRKGDVYAAWEKICRIYKEWEAMTVDICNASKDLCEIFWDAVEILKKSFQEEQGL